VTPSIARLAVIVCVAGCARSTVTSQAAPTAASREVPAHPTSSSDRSGPQSASPGVLASLASQPLVVLPVQNLRLAVPGWSQKVGEHRAYLASLDDEIAFAVREAGVRGKWAFPPALARASRRNPTYAADPYAIAFDQLVLGEKEPDKPIGEPLAGQLRALAALFDARHALVPTVLRLTPEDSGGRATLHLVVVDVRAARVTWKGDVTGALALSFTPAIAAGVAGGVAELFSVPR
jgi:hypothetical protein